MSYRQTGAHLTPSLHRRRVHHAPVFANVQRCLLQGACQLQAVADVVSVCQFPPNDSTGMIDHHQWRVINLVL